MASYCQFWTSGKVASEWRESCLIEVVTDIGYDAVSLLHILSASDDPDNSLVGDTWTSHYLALSVAVLAEENIASRGKKWE